MTVHLVYLGTCYVHPLTRQIFRYIVVSNWQYYLKPCHTSSMLFNWSLMKLQGFALPLDLSTHWSSVSQFCVRHLLPFYQPTRPDKECRCFGQSLCSKDCVSKRSKYFLADCVCNAHCVSNLAWWGGGDFKKNRGNISAYIHIDLKVPPCWKLFTLLIAFFFTLFKKHWLNQESGFIVARITILYWSHWVLSGEEGRPQQKLNLMYLSAHNQWRHRSAKFSSSSPS